MKNPITAVIVEDEELARDLLLDYLKDHSEIQVTGTYADGFSAIQAINKERPDVVFLDIKIPKISGIEMLELLDYRPVIVFTTAFDDYAIKAFEIRAMDYLLKPFSRDRLAEAITRIIHAVDQISENSGPAVPEMLKPNEILTRIVVKSGTRIHILPTSDILYLEAQDDYVMIHTEKKRFMKLKTMKYYEEHLNPLDFIRIHRSYIVSVNRITRLEQYEKEAYRLHLPNKQQVPVSKSGYKKLREALHF